MIITLSDNGFDTMDPIHIETGLGIVIAMCIAIAVALVILVVWLSRPNRRPTKTANHGRHDAATGTSVWHERIDDVVARHAKGDLTRENAFALLAAIARDLHPQPPAAMCAAKRSPILKRLHARQAISMVSPCSDRPSKRCIRRNSLMPNAITLPGRPPSNKPESGLPILWKGGDEWNCHGTGRGPVSQV